MSVACAREILALIYLVGGPLNRHDIVYVSDSEDVLLKKLPVKSVLAAQAARNLAAESRTQMRYLEDFKRYRDPGPRNRPSGAAPISEKLS